MFWKLKYWWQRRTRGWDDTQLWNLDVSFAEWILPRLIEYKKQNSQYSHPSNYTQEEWIIVLDSMIEGFYLMGSEKNFFPNMEEGKKIDLALYLFSQECRGLWS